MPGQSDDQVTDKDASRLAKRLAMNQCVNIKYLAAELSVKIEDNVQTTAREQFFKVLITWQEREGDHATVGLLRQALGEASE